MSLTRTELLNEFDHGWFECDRWQTAMLTQLQRNLAAIKSGGGSDGGGSAKPKSKPPMDLSAMDLFYECAAECRRVREDSEAPLGRLMELRGTVRLNLGYEVGMMRLDGSMVCHQCAGPLIVARDASSAVECAENCGVSYPMNTWVELLAQKGVSDEHAR